jgi:hypothetical protein
MPTASPPVGQDDWVAYIDEARRNATDLERNVGIVELYKRAVAAEPGSLVVWLAYCEFVHSLYSRCFQPDNQWPEEEYAMGRELFSLATALEQISSFRQPQTLESMDRARDGTTRQDEDARRRATHNSPLPRPTTDTPFDLGRHIPDVLEFLVRVQQRCLGGYDEGGHRSGPGSETTDVGS